MPSTASTSSAVVSSASTSKSGASSNWKALRKVGHSLRILFKLENKAESCPTDNASISSSSGIGLYVQETQARSQQRDFRSCSIRSRAVYSNYASRHKRQRQRQGEGGTSWRRRRYRSTSRVSVFSITKKVFSSTDRPAATGNRPGHYISLDCEFVGLYDPANNHGEHSLARVSIVNYHGAVVLDTFVAQRERVGDWRTWVSGVRAEDVKNGRHSLREKVA